MAQMAAYRGLKDCFKHLVLASLLERMGQLPEGFTYVDTHSGWGLYDLTAPQAAVHQNHLYGIMALPGSSFLRLPRAASAHECSSEVG